MVRIDPPVEAVVVAGHRQQGLGVGLLLAICRCLAGLQQQVTTRQSGLLTYGGLDVSGEGGGRYAMGLDSHRAGLQGCVGQQLLCGCPGAAPVHLDAVQHRLGARVLVLQPPTTVDGVMHP